MTKKLRFRADRPIGAVKVMIENAKKDGQPGVTIDINPLEALV